MKTFSEYSKHQQLVEAIEADNDTGYRSEDLALMVEQHESGEWEQFDSAESLIEEMRKDAEAYKNGKA